MWFLLKIMEIAYMVEPILKMEVAGIKYTKPLRQETTCSEYSTRALSPPK